MYYYKSPVGTFWIKEATDGSFVLGIGDIALGFYVSPVAAADDVYTHTTGHYPWDLLDCEVDGPSGISEWSRG